MMHLVSFALQVLWGMAAFAAIAYGLAVQSGPTPWAASSPRASGCFSPWRDHDQGNGLRQTRPNDRLVDPIFRLVHA